MNIIVNPAHGNEPFILGAYIADAVRSLLNPSATLIVPHIYSHQQRILAELGIGNIVLDSALGNFYGPLLFSQGDFGTYLQAVLEQRETVEIAVRRYVYETYGAVNIEVNTGSRIRIADCIHYAFPAAVSQVLQYTLHEEGSLGFNISDLERSLAVAKQVEASFATVFIPAFHTFSYDSQRVPLAREVSTPPMKPFPVPCSLDIPQQSWYCMPSGTGSEIDTVLSRAKELAEQGYAVIVPPWTPHQGYRRETPAVIAHPHVVKVVGRAGWGTLWTCQQAEKEFAHIPYRAGEDPEIFFNVRTLEAIAFLERTRQDRQRFLAHGSSYNGIQFIAQHIVSDC